MNGKGRIVYTSGNLYEGDFMDHMKHGEGTFYWSTGQKWTGEFYYDNICN